MLNTLTLTSYYRSDSIHTIDYYGKDHRLILKHHEGMMHPFAITLFGNYVYWTDWGTNSLMRVSCLETMYTGQIGELTHS